MSLVEELHVAHKARLRRISDAAARLVPKPVIIAIDDSSDDGEIPVVIAPEIVAEIPQTPEQAKRALVREIQQAVADDFGIGLDDLTAPCKRSHFVRPRQIAIYLTRELTPFGSKNIGRCFGYRDHTTVIYSIQKVKEMMTFDAGLRDRVERLKVGLAQ